MGRIYFDQIDKKYKFLRLLAWLIERSAPSLGRSSPRDLSIPYRAVEPLKTQGGTYYYAGQDIPLGSANNLAGLMNIQIRTINAVLESFNYTIGDRLSAPNISFWINLTEIFKILDDLGTPVYHPDTGEKIVFRDVESVIADGQSVAMAGWERLRQYHEQDLLGELSEYFSEPIAAYYNPPQLKPGEGWADTERSRRKGFRPRTPQEVEREVLELTRKFELLPSKTQTDFDRLRNVIADAIKHLPSKDQAAIKGQIPGGEDLLQPSKLAQMVQAYMATLSIDSTEDLAASLSVVTFSGKPADIPLYQESYEQAVDLLDKIIAGAKPYPAHAGYIVVMQALATRLQREDGAGFDGNVEALIAYCFGEENGAKVKKAGGRKN